MYIVIFCSLIAILFTYLESIGKMRNGMLWGFMMLAFLAVIHYDYGNDYLSYYQTFQEVTRFPFDIRAIMDGIYYREPGWTLLCFLFKHLGGFFVMVAVLNIFQNIVFYRFIRDNLQIEWRTMAVFIYVCSTNLYLMNFSMMRQGFAAAVFLALWPLIKQKKYIPVVVITMYLLSYIHSSAQFLIPVAFWGFIPFKKGKLIAVFFSLLFVVIWFGSNIIEDTLNRMLEFEAFEEYIEKYGDETNTNTKGIGFILQTIPFFVALYHFLKNEDIKEKNAICALGICGVLLKPFTSVIPLLGRFFVYFSVYSIVALPLCYKSIENKPIRIGLVALFVLILFYDYIIFFSNPIWIDKFTEFHTIFEAI